MTADQRYEVDILADLVRQRRVPLVALIAALRSAELWVYQCFEAWPHAFGAPLVQTEFQFTI
jgi:hypothetical protein